MNTTRRRCLHRLCLSVLCAGMLFSAGCSKKVPAEANAALNAALDALHKGDGETFIAGVLPAQQKKVKTLGEYQFFLAAKSHKVDNEFDLEVTDDSALVMTKLYFDDEKKAFSNLFMAMTKADGKWYIDLDKTIKKEREINPGHAFQQWKFGQ